MRIRIIIADDHRVFIDGMKALLQEENDFEVVGEAMNGQQLLDETTLKKPDVILSDIQMPVMDGVAATIEIQKQHPAVKVIALTMLNEIFFIRKMLEAGAAGYVLKTIDKAELFSVIRKVAAGEKYFSPEVTAKLMNNFSASAAASDASSSLTKREKEILKLIAEGLTDKEIADKIFLSPLTVTTHRKNILSKLGLKNKVELTRFAMDNNLM